MQYSPEIISKNIKKERKKLNMTQEKLGQKISKKLNAKRELTGKQISIYENPKNDTIPPLKVLLTMCDIFNCELGYLLGEENYSNGTQNSTIVVKETGFTEEALQQIRTVMGICPVETAFNMEAEEYQRMLNNFVSSPQFIKFVIELKHLDDIYRRRCYFDKKYDRELKEINSKLATIDPKKANFIREKYDDPIDFDEALTPEELAIRNSLSDDEKKLIPRLKSLDSEYEDNKIKYERNMKCQRYNIQEIMSFLLNDLYPIDSN